MSKLVVNIKLALPGLAVLARDCFFESVSDGFTKQLKDSVDCIKRVGFDVTPILSLVEELYFDSINEVTITSVRKLLASVTKELRADPTTNIAIVELLQAVSGTLAADNKHYISLRDKVGLLNKPEITSLFPIELDTTIQQNNIAFVEEFSAEEIKQLKESKDPQYKEVLRAKRIIRTVTTDFIKRYCRTKGGLVAFKDLYDAIEQEKLKHSLPRGFEGFIDEYSVLYTKARKQIDGFPSDCDITMNTKYNPSKDDSHVFSARSPLAKSSTYFYTVAYRTNAKQNKFKTVQQLSVNIDSIRSKWLAKLKITNPQFEEAAILELIYQTQARIGSDSNATLDKRTGEYKRTYGISTIRHKHFTVEKDGSISFCYPGKAAFKGDTVHYQKHTLYPIDTATKILIDWFIKIDGCDPESPVFSTTAAKVRALFKDIGAPEGVSVHKLRTLKGTLMMKDKIKKHPFKAVKTSSTAVTKWLKDEALDVGIQLGHMSGEKYTASTAIAHYIDPSAMLKLYKEARVAPPRTMLKLVGITKNSIESVH